jgi:Phage integrase SAM-like domain
MPSVNFYLKKPPGKLPFALIYLQFKYSGQKLVYSFGQKINPPDWSKETKRVKSNRHTILDGRYAVNELLDKLEKHCLRVYEEERVKGVPPASVMKFRLDAFMRQQEGKKKEPGIYSLIDRFISGEIKNKGKEKSPNTLKNYATAKTHLYAFDTKTRYHLQFENINLDFFDRYIRFLREEEKLKPNSIARDIGALKTVMTEAVELGYTTNIQFRHKKFNVVAGETDAVHLTEKEITRLYRFDCAGNKRLEQVRDLFVYGCFTGVQPHSVARPLRATHKIKQLIIKEIDGNHFLLVPDAAGSGSPVPLPCHPLVQEILLKYGGQAVHLPKGPSNQKFNDYIKEVCRLAGLIEKGRLSTSPGQELWACISSRTARLSMAAYYYRSGHPIHELMRITGHSTDKAFLKYIHARPGINSPEKS